MRPRRLLGWVPVAALALCAWTACKGDKDKKDESGTTSASADLMTRCDLLAKTCGDSDKHVQKIAAECKEAAKEQVASGCTEKALAAYDCYLRELCGKADKVWALDDLRVLSDRHGKCVAERDATGACVAN
ncbi:MAG TPA: hypothetical protein VFU21_09120 [Kofleriaceae bacterium]|nr:hypothetical protein [Kofleriaceae bacterium]